MSQTILVYNHHPKLQISPHYLKTKTEQIFTSLGLKDPGIEITLVDDDFMTEQNERFMGKTGTTDVLSFPQIEPKEINKPCLPEYENKYIGDVLISLDEAKRQADLQNIDLEQEVVFLILHSVLHLIGYDHASEEQESQMQALESKVWNELQN